ncbi:DUF2637 domain-containing protein, partial [Streptomyces sp. NPDC001089]
MKTTQQTHDHKPPQSRPASARSPAQQGHTAPTPRKQRPAPAVGARIRQGRTHKALIGVVVAGALVIAGIGFAGSYAAVRELALKKG